MGRVRRSLLRSNGVVFGFYISGGAGLSGAASSRGPRRIRAGHARITFLSYVLENLRACIRKRHQFQWPEILWHRQIRVSEKKNPEQQDFGRIDHALSPSATAREVSHPTSRKARRCTREESERVSDHRLTRSRTSTRFWSLRGKNGHKKPVSRNFKTASRSLKTSNGRRPYLCHCALAEKTGPVGD
jgi:hypothetical protein